MTVKLSNIKKWLLLMGIVFLYPIIPYVHAGETSIIELNDGSVISGEVVSFDGSTWTIKSESMGTIKIGASKVVSIHSKKATGRMPAGGVSGGGTVNKDDIQAMQQSLVGNEQIMAMIMNLQNDPEVQEILQDPEIMKAVNAGDVNALMANPKFIKFMENANIRAITKEAVK